MKPAGIVTFLEVIVRGEPDGAVHRSRSVGRESLGGVLYMDCILVTQCLADRLGRDSPDPKRNDSRFRLSQKIEGGLQYGVPVNISVKLRICRPVQPSASRCDLTGFHKKRNSP